MSAHPPESYIPVTHYGGSTGLIPAHTPALGNAEAYDLEQQEQRKWDYYESSAKAEQAAERAAERYWENDGGIRSMQSYLENQADLRHHDSLFPNGYR